VESVKVFISHTTRDQRDFTLAHRLAAGIQANGGEFWIAPDSIPPGERWEEHIVSGVMKECSHFLIIISQAAIEAEWVLKEIELARQRQSTDATFKILPIIVGKVGNYPHSDFISKLQWISYQNNFGLQLDAVISALKLKPAIPETLKTVIEDKTRDFVGRNNVFAALDDFLSSNSRGYFTIVGDPGAGKSAILAEFVRRSGCIAHFNVRSSGINTTSQFIQSICAQLITRFGLPFTSIPDDVARDGAFLVRILNEASEQAERLIIAVDALDEVEFKEHPKGANILFLPASLPDGVFFVLTRREVDLPFVVHEPQLEFNLNEHRSETFQDVELYLKQAAKRSALEEWLTTKSIEVAQFVQTLKANSDGNFMYLRYVLPEIERGTYDGLSLDKLPKGLEGYYEDHWHRMGMGARPLPRVKIRIVYILCEVRQSVSRRLITQFADTVDMRVDELTVQEVLDEWNQFLHEQPIENGTQYSIYHASFRDFLHRMDIVQAAGVSLAEINGMIADDLWDDLIG